MIYVINPQTMVVDKLCKSCAVIDQYFFVCLFPELDLHIAYVSIYILR